MTVRKRLHILAAVIATAAGVMGAMFPLANQHQNASQVISALIWGLMTALLIYMGILGWGQMLLFPLHEAKSRQSRWKDYQNEEKYSYNR